MKKTKAILFSIGLFFSIFIFGIALNVKAYSGMNYGSLEHNIGSSYVYVGAFLVSSYGADENSAPMIRLQYYDVDNPNTLITNNIINIAYNQGNDYWIINNNQSAILYNNQLYMYQIYTAMNSTLIDIYELDFEVSGGNYLTCNNVTLIYTSDYASYNWNEVSGNVKAVFNCAVVGMTPFTQKYNTTQLLNFYNSMYRSQYNNALYYYGEAKRQQGYDVGYIAGQEGVNAISPIWNVLTGIFSAVGSIFAIELAPHIYLGYFILVPLFFAMVLGILSIWRKNY